MVVSSRTRRVATSKMIWLTARMTIKGKTYVRKIISSDIQIWNYVFNGSWLDWIKVRIRCTLRIEKFASIWYYEETIFTQKDFHGHIYYNQYITRYYRVKHKYILNNRKLNNLLKIICKVDRFTNDWWEQPNRLSNLSFPGYLYFHSPVALTEDCICYPSL